MTNEEGHRALWNWLADNPDQKKQDWPGWEDNLEASHHCCCFACYEAALANEDNDKEWCPPCPIDWRTKKVFRSDKEFCCCTTLCCCTTQGTLYSDWRRASDLEVRSELARHIANLPWRSLDVQ